MTDYFDANRRSWALIAEDHYHAFKSRFAERAIRLNEAQMQELGDIRGKSLIHLQCNVGADTVSLARMGAKVTGVDLVPENIYFARKLASDCGIHDARFIESNVLEIADVHHETYDIVYTSEGVLCWLPDLALWARNVRALLKDDGFLYLMDSHPVYMLWDEDKLPELNVKYPYFIKQPDRDEWIGGYASEAREGTNYSWMYTMGEIITALAQAGLCVEWLHEFDWLFFANAEKMVEQAFGEWVYPEHKSKLPYTFSLRASPR